MSKWWTEFGSYGLHTFSPEFIFKQLGERMETELLGEARRLLVWARAQELAATIASEVAPYEAAVAVAQAERDDAAAAFKLAEIALDFARRAAVLRRDRERGAYDALRPRMMSADLGIEPVREAPGIEPDPDLRPTWQVQGELAARKQAVDRAREQLEIAENVLANAKKRLARAQRVGPGLLAFERPDAPLWHEFLGMLGIDLE